jgi:hypothetical protein
MRSLLARGPHLIGLAVCLLALLAPAAPAGVESKRDRRGDAAGPLDIASVRVVGKPGVGLAVTVMFRRNFERAVGRGRLKRALAAVALVPKSRRARTSLVVTDRAGHYGRTRRRSRSRNVLVMRKGRRLDFVILGTGAENVRSVRVATFAAPPTARRGAGRASGRGDALDLILRGFGIVTEREDTASILTSLGQSESCRQLRSSINSYRQLQARSLEEYDRALADGESAKAQAAKKSRDEWKATADGAEQVFESQCSPRTCAFSLSGTGSERKALVTWKCDQNHRRVEFEFSSHVVAIASDVGNAAPPVCRILNTDSTVVICEGDFQAGQTYIFVIETAQGESSCPSLFFVPEVDSRRLPQVNCAS